MGDGELKVGVQLQPQGSSVESILEAARCFDEMGVDSLWIWDHFFPIYGAPDAGSFESYTLMSAMAVATQRATIGALVTGIGYRNPNLLADMARTIDHLSNGRFVLGVGSGWFERDYQEYGFEFGSAGDKLKTLERSLGTIKDRIAVLNPSPVGPLPILIGGSGPKVTLRIVAEHGDAWNTFGPPKEFARLNSILDEWCDKVGRDPSTIERTVAISADEIALASEFREAGATHLILMLAHPFETDEVEELLAVR